MQTVLQIPSQSHMVCPYRAHIKSHIGPLWVPYLLLTGWCIQSRRMVVQCGTLKVYFFKMNLKSSRKKAARFVTGNKTYETGSRTGILEQLKWESLKNRRKDSRLIMLNKGLKGAASIPTNGLVPPNRRTRIHQPLAF